MGDKDKTTVHQKQQTYEATPVTAEEYLRNLLSKGRKTKMLEDIMKHLKAKHKKIDLTAVSGIQKSYTETHAHPDN